MEYPEELYYTKDIVTDDIDSLGIGEVWLYYYKETMIGARHVREKVSYFIDADTKNDTKAPMAPTLKNLTNEHVQAAINEHDQSTETCHRVHFQELFRHATMMLYKETNLLADQVMMGQI